MDTENVVVTKQDRKYKTLVTDIGKEKMTNAILNGKKVNVVMAAVGDGGGSYYLPTADMTALVHEVWRGAIASKEINSKSSNMVDVKFVLPGTVGGFTAREASLIDDEGDMIAVCNLPDTEKAAIEDGIAAALTILMHIVMTNSDALTFTLDPTTDTASAVCVAFTIPHEAWQSAGGAEADEGGGKIESGAAFGAPDLSIAQVDLMEKGYADLELTVRSIGGHSSRPYGGTSLAHLACAIADIVRSPFPVRLNPAMMGAFETLAPYITAEPLRTLTRDIRANADTIAAYCYQSSALFPFVTTTIAPTVIQGSSKACNVMPQDMQAVINFRLADGDTVESVMEHCRAAVQDPTVELRYQQANDPSATARRDGYGYRTVVDSMRRYYPDVVFVPSMTVGATDAHQYEQICDTCLRCSPFMAEPEEAASGVHGTNERILVRAYLQGIRVLIDLMEHANL